jgi:hypothetical protein
VLGEGFPRRFVDDFIGGKIDEIGNGDVRHPTNFSCKSRG